MSRRTLLLSIVALVLFVGLGFFVAWYFLFSQSTPGSETASKEGGLFDFLNFGKAETATDTGGEEVVNETPLQEVKAPRLRKLSDVPVSAAIATTTKDGLFVRYIERGTGHVYDVSPDTGVKTRQSNTTIPRIQEAFWLPGGGSILVRYFDSELQFAETFLGKLGKDTRAATGTSPFLLDGTFLPEGISAAVASESEQKTAYVLESDSGSTLFTTNKDGGGKAQILSSPIREWLLQWFKADTIALTTKPSATSPGFLFFLPAKGGQLERVLPGKFGLTTLVSPSGERVLFSEATQGGLSAEVYIRKSREERLLPIQTLPEKCVWSKNEPTVAYCGVPQAMERGNYPDVWYMGFVSFKDSIWKIDTEAGAGTLIEVPDSSAPQGIDLVRPILTKAENYLVFINKKDGTLWALELE